MRREIARGRVQHLRLDGEHENVGGPDRLRGVERHALFGAERLQLGARLRIEDDHVPGRDAQIKPAAQQRPAHAAGADERQRPRQPRRFHASPAVSNRAVVRASLAVLPAQSTKLNAWK